MDYLDYVQMTKGQQIKYKITSFFTGIIPSIGTFFKFLGYLIGKFFSWIANGFKNYGARFAQGDGATKASYLIMGVGNMAHKQFGKGLIFLAAEIGYILFMINFGSIYLGKIYSNGVHFDPDDYNKVADGVIGNVPVHYTVDPFFGTKTIDNLDTLDNSNNILLFFVMTILISIAFFALYIVNTKSAFATQELLRSGKRPMSAIEELKMFLDERFHVTLLTLPILLLLVFNVLPIFFTILMAFTNYDSDHQPPGNLYRWVGFQNFNDVFYSNPLKSATFGKILVWTFIWAIFATFSNYILGIVFALLINKKEIRFKGFWRTAFVITAAVPQFVTLLLMKLLLDDKGALNAMLGTQIPFLSNETAARITVIVVNIWVGVPYTILITSGLLMNIPEDLYESARIDGANAFQQFTKITFPYIFFVTTPYLISSFVGNINNFNVIYFLTGGGPSPSSYYKAGQTDLLVTWLYKLTVNTSDFNLAAVIGIIVFVICAAGSLITFNMSKAAKNEEEFS